MESVLYILVFASYTVWKASFTYSYREKGARMENRLEEIRKARGIKQEDLALELGVSRQTISSLEKGRYNPSILLAFKIARRFDLRIEDVFIYQEEDHE